MREAAAAVICDEQHVFNAHAALARDVDARLRRHDRAGRHGLVVAHAGVRGLMDEQAQAVAGQRRSQVGSGMRNERIRTYNFPQGRVTDHRIGLTLYKLDAVMNGELEELVEGLSLAEQRERLKRSEDG